MLPFSFLFESFRLCLLRAWNGGRRQGVMMSADEETAQRGGSTMMGYLV